MKRTFFAITTALLLSGTVTQAQNETYFTAYPALTPDAQTVVFSFEGDLWKVPATGGAATRLTAMPGEEINPRVSPDGKWLAFSSNQFGNYDVYVMPMAGGTVKQLTFNDTADEVDNWSWDSKTIYFSSGRYNMYTTYTVGANGGTAKRLFPNFFNTIHNVAEAPSGELFFNDTWESKNFANRKRYKGAFNPDIQSYNPKTKAYKQYTDYKGKDLWATVAKSGKVYYASDEGNDEYNLYTFEGDKKLRLTDFPSAIKRPFVAANGASIVFERDYQLYLYNVSSKTSRKINIEVSRNTVLSKDQEFDVRGSITDFDASPDGKKLAFVSRGELFVSDAEGKFIRKINRGLENGINERVMEVKWLSDNRTLVFNQTFKGYPNWFSIAADGKGKTKQLTSENRSNRAIAFNKDRTQAVYLSGRDEVRVMDLKSLESKTIVKDEIWAFQNANPSFSPDGAYVLFTAYRNFEQDIFVHHLKQNKTINLTNTGVTETSPSWSPDGKYIFFTSLRTKPSYPFGMQNGHVYRMALDDYDEPYRLDKFDELFNEKKKDKTAPADNKTDKDKKKPSKSEKEKAKADSLKKAEDKSKEASMFVINTQNLMDRITLVSPNFGTQSGAEILEKGDKTYAFYSSDHEGGGASFYRTVIENFENNKTEKVTDGYASIQQSGDKYYILSRGTIHKYNIDMNRLDRLDIGYKFNRNLNEEFNQMFYESWAGLEENFYSEDFHGVDWMKMRQQYARFLPYLNNRSDLRVLLNDMLGELNSSHLGFSTYGADERKSLNYATNETGIVFDDENPFKVSRVVAQSNGRHKGVGLRAGDVITAVNGVPLDASIDRDYYFTTPSLEQEMELTLTREGKIVTTKVHPQSTGTLKGNLYDEWITENRERVKTLGNNRIAYSYMKNMGGDELERFLLDMVAQENNKEGIILDLRYNTGGNVHDEVLRFLSQRPYLQWKYRGGKLSPQSNFAPAAKPIVLLINEQSLSDAEMTAAGFKALKLGKIIGTETYRWIIFTSGKGLVDGSFYRLPSWGCFTLDGKNLEKEGVAPDIYVKNTFVDRLEDKDPQLERAVAEILQDLKK
ncbi:putative Tricorn-like protease [Pedobacter sp. BAL39]|uniref:S41 family peptidase n=1 Tax=Pedobacter sp. BAL39 TaxID=391596 RepID=UPI0001559AD6|nr:S41 family peptidase [Pedobacter sp. BAL39]EDM37244.1 putative Tricorn-like protease [Pedobacter sp. BAL39]